MSNVKNINYNIGFIGAGNVTMAIVKGLINYSKINPKHIIVSAPSNNNLPKFKLLGCKTINDNYKLVKQYKCLIVFFNVKPQHVANDISIFNLINVNYPLLIVSSIAGFTLTSLYKYCFKQYSKIPNCKIYRMMPNLTCEVGSGSCAISRFLPISQEHEKRLINLFDKIFICNFMNEEQLDHFLALSSSGIAFVYTFIQAMIDSGVKIGISRDLSLKIVLETLCGASNMVKKTKQHPIQLRDCVCSPAGTTIYGIHVLENNGFSSSIMQAVETSYQRCLEFKKNLN